MKGVLKWIFPLAILIFAPLLSAPAFGQGTGKISPEWSYLIGGIPTSVGLSEDGKYIAIGYIPVKGSGSSSENPSKLLLMTSAGKVLWEKGFTGVIYSISFSRDSKYVAVLLRNYTETQEIIMKLYLFSTSGSLIFSKSFSISIEYLGIEIWSPSKVILSDSLGKIFVKVGNGIWAYSMSGDLLWNYSVSSKNSLIASMSLALSRKELIVSEAIRTTGSLYGKVLGIDPVEGKVLWAKNIGFIPLRVEALNSSYVVAGFGSQNENSSECWIEASSYSYSGKVLWNFTSQKTVSPMEVTLLELKASKNGNYTMISLREDKGPQSTPSESYLESIWILNSKGKVIWSKIESKGLLSGDLAENGQFFALENSAERGGIRISLLDMGAKLHWEYTTIGSTSKFLGSIVRIAPDSSYVLAIVVWGSESIAPSNFWGMTAVYFFSNLAKLSVQSYPEAKVYINGKYYGETPITISLPPGSYQVSVQKKGYYTSFQNVTLGPLEYKEISVRLWNVLTPTDYVAIGALVALAVVGGISAWHYERTKHRKL